MRSLLFVPADGGRKLDKAMASGADGVIVDLEDSIALESKAAARKSAADFLKDACKAASRPRIIVRVNAIETGLIDEDLDAVVWTQPDAILLPKAQGGASVIHADAKIAVREAIAGLSDGSIKILAIATETADALFLAGTYGGASQRLIALTWGAEDLSADLHAETNRDDDGSFLDPYRLARALCLAGAAAARWPHWTRSPPIFATPCSCGGKRKKRDEMASPAKSQFTPRRCPSSMKFSPRQPTRLPTRVRSSRRLKPIPAEGQWRWKGSCMIGRILHARAT